MIKHIESTQANSLKSVNGIPKRSHHSNLLSALNVYPVKSVVSRNTVSLWHRTFKVDSPSREINAYLLSQYILFGYRVKGTLIDRVLMAGCSPTSAIFTKPSQPHITSQSGVTDSLRYLLMHENFIKPYSDEHILSVLLTKAF